MLSNSTLTLPVALARPPGLPSADACAERRQHFILEVRLCSGLLRVPFPWHLMSDMPHDMPHDKISKICVGQARERSPVAGWLRPGSGTARRRWARRRCC